ncbi:hypothetical protein N9878_01335 [bacterium]|nr:hypothetical protein [bacterium]
MPSEHNDMPEVIWATQEESVYPGKHSYAYAGTSYATPYARIPADIDPADAVVVERDWLAFNSEQSKDFSIEMHARIAELEGDAILDKTNLGYAEQRLEEANARIAEIEEQKVWMKDHHDRVVVLYHAANATIEKLREAAKMSHLVSGPILKTGGTA